MITFLFVNTLSFPIFYGLPILPWRYFTFLLSTKIKKNTGSLSLHWVLVWHFSFWFPLYFQMARICVLPHLQGTASVSVGHSNQYPSKYPCVQHCGLLRGNFPTSGISQTQAAADWHRSFKSSDCTGYCIFKTAHSNRRHCRHCSVSLLLPAYLQTESRTCQAARKSLRFPCLTAKD